MGSCLKQNICTHLNDDMVSGCSRVRMQHMKCGMMGKYLYNEPRVSVCAFYLNFPHMTESTGVISAPWTATAAKRHIPNLITSS